MNFIFHHAFLKYPTQIAYWHFAGQFGPFPFELKSNAAADEIAAQQVSAIDPFHHNSEELPRPSQSIPPLQQS